jgi:hypothetical protein
MASVSEVVIEGDEEGSEEMEEVSVSPSEAPSTFVSSNNLKTKALVFKLRLKYFWHRKIIFS